MTVAVLKEELKKRGLDATGLKAALVARLEEAMAGEDDGAAAEAAAPEEEEAKEEPKEEAGEEEDVRAKAEEMAEKAMAEHAASEKKRERSPEQDDAPPEAKSAKSDGEHAAAPSSAQGGLTKDGQNLATYEMPDGQVRKDVPTQGNEGRIIGRGGSKIRELQDMFRTRITMNRPAGLAEVVGMLDHVNDCCDEITRIVEDGNVREAAERAGQPVPGGAYSSYGGGGFGGGGGGFGGGGGGFGGGGGRRRRSFQRPYGTRPVRRSRGAHHRPRRGKYSSRRVPNRHSHQDEPRRQRRRSVRYPGAVHRSRAHDPRVHSHRAEPRWWWLWRRWVWSTRRLRRRVPAARLRPASRLRRRIPAASRLRPTGVRRPGGRCAAPARLGGSQPG